MRALWRRRALSALLAAGVAATGLPGMGRAADEPDLTIEPGAVHLFMNAAGQVNDRVVSFKVTNVSNRDVPVSEATGTLEITSPPPGSAVPLQNDKLIAKNGGSFQGVAQLPAPCDGTVVTVSLFAKGETNRGNNTVGPLKLCPDKPQPVPQPSDTGVVIVGPPISIVDIMLPEHLRPGPHELQFRPSALRSLARHTYGGVHRGPYEDSSDPDYLWVGWDGRDPIFDLSVSQTAVNFDLAKLHEVGRPRVTAHLSFIEHENEWTGSDGYRVDIPGCVSRLGYATNDWGLPPQQFVSPDFLFRDQPLTSVFIPRTTTAGEPGSIERWRAFDVTSHVQRQVDEPDDPRWWFGYVLHGQVEGDDRTDTSCLSRISGINLWVTYVVGSN